MVCLTYTESKSLALEDGSFDDQTYGKDGVVLFYNYESEDTLTYFMMVSEKFKNNDKIHFWHINCDHADLFCENRPEILNSGIPSMLYSFRNELWQSKNCKTYKEHAFEVFFKTKLQENCLNTPKLCSSVMNMTLKEHGEKNHTELKKLYEEEKMNGDELEREWGDITSSIQSEWKKKREEYINDDRKEEWDEVSNKLKADWNEKRAQFVLDIKKSDEKLKVYGLLMEKIHSDSYEKTEGEVQQIVIDMNQKYY
jgi:hypothetical protein